MATALRTVRQADQWFMRRFFPARRSVLANAQNAMEAAMMAPVLERLREDPRIRIHLTSTVRPNVMERIYGSAQKGEFVTPRRAAFLKADVYLTADFEWIDLIRQTCRVQMFHGVAGKYSHIYDRPKDVSGWHRFFFINERRLQNFVRSGALPAGSAASRLVGMPKVDKLVNGAFERSAVLGGFGLDPERPSILFAPTWSPYSALNQMGEALVSNIIRAGYTLIVKLHENSRDPLYANSGGVDWFSRLRPLLPAGRGYLAEGGDACAVMAAADVMITDHSSIGFEYLLLDRPLLRVWMPELIARTNIPEDYVALLAEASHTIAGVEELLPAIEKQLSDPHALSSSRKAVAQEMFYKPGTATDRAVNEIYQVLELGGN